MSTNTLGIDLNKASVLRRGKLLEYFTIIWNSL